jgi:hypothetical protein
VNPYDLGEVARDRIRRDALRHPYRRRGPVNGYDLSAIAEDNIRRAALRGAGYQWGDIPHDRPVAFPDAQFGIGDDGAKP